jgi:hypothetical protein
MTDYNWHTFSDKELAAFIRNGGLAAGYDTDFNRAMVEETASRLEAAEAAEAERDAFAAENDAIHRAINEMCGTDTSTIEAVQHVIEERNELRVKLEQAQSELRELRMSIIEGATR